MSKELTDPAAINAMVDPTGALARAGLYNPLLMPVGIESELPPVISTKHTPGPWTSHGNNVLAPDGFVCECPAIDPVTDQPRRPPSEYYANAAFIVRACNAHGDLVTALESAINSMLSLGATEDWPQIAQYRAAVAKAWEET